MIFTLLVVSSCTLVPVINSPAVIPLIDTPPIVAPIIPKGETILPMTCTDESEWLPIITSLSTRSGSIGSTLVIEGCNFAGFEGDKQVWIENTGGTRWILYGEAVSTPKSITVILKTSLCQSDTSYSGLDCEASMDLIAWQYQIYVMPWGKMSNKVDFTVVQSHRPLENPVIKTDLSYEVIKSYIDSNITDIITWYSTFKPANGKWFADGYGFTSMNDVYVDYEDWHSLYRGLLHCDNPGNILTCTPVAIFEKNEAWIVIQWEDTQKNNPILYQSAKDYTWTR